MNTPFIVSAQYLNKCIDDPQIVIIDCRFALAEPELGCQQYQISHIPGAHYLDLNKDLSGSLEQHGGRHPLPNPEQLAAKLAAIGVNFQQTLVVAYDDSRLAFAGRLWWLLRYLGHERVAVLDGGFSAWQAAGYRITNHQSQSKPAVFVPQIQKSWVVDIETVKTTKDLPGVTLVDSRQHERYLGLQEPIDPVAGHIPGAINYPWQEVTNDQGYLKLLEEQKQRWADLTDTTEIIVYCGSGVTACVNLLSLELAGMSIGKLYAGSWSDWCSYLQ
ncbi:MAG: sulfurtransferase [Symploca sp. SIO3C6]|nr:sulfurtransferase [Symploca sp. SIO3C6]